MYTVRQPPTGNLLDNWQLIKSKWSSSSMQQMYADDDDHILIFKKSSYFEVISYLHANTDIILIPIEGFLDIIGGVTEKVKRWSPNEITIITNFPLSFFSERISELPSFINYQLINVNNEIILQQLQYEVRIKNWYYIEEDYEWDYFNGTLTLIFYADEILYKASIAKRYIEFVLNNSEIDCLNEKFYFTVTPRTSILFTIDIGGQIKEVTVSDYFEKYFTNAKAEILVKKIWYGRQHNSSYVGLTKFRPKKNRQ